MPSMAHEILLDLFKTRPSLAAEILAEGLGRDLPAYTEARLASTDLTEVQPAEYRADLVVTLMDRGKPGPVRVIIVEVQLKVDPRKRFTWPAYVTVSRAIHRCPVDLLVVSPDPALAGWCGEAIEIGVPGFTLCPPVLRWTDVPVVTDRADAGRRPELAVLSAMAHGDTEKGAEIAAAVLPAIEKLDGDDDERARLYFDLVYHSLNEAARQALEEMMKGYEYQSDFAKKYVAQGVSQGRAEGMAQGRAEGMAQGISQGISQGVSQGVSQGLAQGIARSVLTVLRTRGIEVPDAIRERILAQTDTARLERWLERAAVATSAAAVIDDSN